MHRLILCYVMIFTVSAFVNFGYCSTTYQLTADLKHTPVVEATATIHYEPDTSSASDNFGIVLLLDSLSVTAQTIEGRTLTLTPFRTPLIDGVEKKMGRKLGSVAFRFETNFGDTTIKNRSFRLKYKGQAFIDERYELPLLDNWFPMIVELSADGEIISISGGECEATLSLNSEDQIIVTKGDKIITPLTTGGIHVIIKSEVQGDAITDLLIFATPDYEVSKMYSGDVEIRACYTEKSKKWGQRIPDLVVDIVSFYRMYFGFFPYQRITFIAGRTDVTGGGEVAPGILWIHSMFKMGEGAYAKQILAHEIAHLYWGSIGYVRIVQPYLHWLSLGLGLWTDRQYTDHAGLGRSFHERQIGKYISKVKEGKDTIPLSSPKVRARDADLNRILAHGKGYAVVNMLEYLMGTELFEKLIVELLTRYARKNMTIENFLTVSQEMYGRDLSWFFDQWLNTCKFIDYAVDSVHTESGKIRVNIKRLGEAIMPVIVRVTTPDGRTIDNKWDGVDVQAELEFDVIKWTKIEIDPDHWLPDVDLSNDVLMK